ncbi:MULTISPECIES: glycosyltransferase [unclassified Ruegeria]|uniref:glycosyltransferase family 8 protein n=1 Tax=unclassified Ruegeria TaxID=2625375 RepID=UPI001491BF46|nr:MULTISPECIES: glycosyltransferase [unclassified Ruegeria]NOD36241.1 hypothetical protein [Ruegeria sp. HKCCD7296]NOE43634.1 hypothetical protein [Ruegeria sp. HKCCD7319]
MTSDKKMAVVLCTDENQIWQAAYALVRSFLLDTTNEIQHYLYVSAQVDPRLETLFSRYFRIVYCLDDIVPPEKFKSHGYVSQATLLRLKALGDLSHLHEFVLYLDNDIVQRWGSPSDLMQLQGFEQPIAAVADNTRWTQGRFWKNADFNLLPAGAQQKYFNAGMLFVNSRALIAENIFEKALGALTGASDPLPLADQSALNIAVDGNWLELSPSWNWQHSYLPGKIIALLNPRYVHFTGPVKPWANTTREIEEIYTLSLLAFLKHFGLDDVHNEIAAENFPKKRLTHYMKRTHGISEKTLSRYDKSLPYFSDGTFADRQSGILAFGADAERQDYPFPELFNFLGLNPD